MGTKGKPDHCEIVNKTHVLIPALLSLNHTELVRFSLISLSVFADHFVDVMKRNYAISY